MAAIVMFSRTVAMEVKRYGIRVNALTPSLVTGTGTSDRIFAHGFSTKIFDKISAKEDFAEHDGLQLIGSLVHVLGRRGLQASRCPRSSW